MPSVVWDVLRACKAINGSGPKSGEGETLFMNMAIAVRHLPPTLSSVCADTESLGCPGSVERQRLGEGRKDVSFTAISTRSLLRGFCI